MRARSVVRREVGQPRRGLPLPDKCSGDAGDRHDRRSGTAHGVQNGALVHSGIQPPAWSALSRITIPGVLAAELGRLRDVR